MNVKFSRIVGEYTTGTQGPLVFMLAGLHGNEASGVIALRRVFKSLANIAPAFKGKFLGLAGNLPALESRSRFIDRDLNRIWSPEEVARIKELAHDDRNTEEKELIDLLRVIESEISKDYTDKIAVDLHTTSSLGGLFTIITDKKANREIADRLYAPVIFNLADSLSTTTNRYFEEIGITCVAFEAGQHDDPAAIDNHEAAIWLVLEKAGCINSEDIPHLDLCRKRLKEVSNGLPKYVSVAYRHPINGEDRYETVPGFVNFQPIESGQLIGRDKTGPLHSPIEGMMLMPLYQPQGEDGYYVIQELAEPPV